MYNNRAYPDKTIEDEAADFSERYPPHCPSIEEQSAITVLKAYRPEDFQSRLCPQITTLEQE